MGISCVFFLIKNKLKKKKTTKIFLVFSSLHGQHLTPRFIYLFFSPWFCDVEKFGQKFHKIRKINQIYNFKKKSPYFFRFKKWQNVSGKTKAQLAYTWSSWCKRVSGTFAFASSKLLYNNNNNNNNNKFEKNNIL